MGFFRGAHGERGGGGSKSTPTLKSVTHILQWWNLAQRRYLIPYTLPKEDPKNIWITWHTSWVLLTSTFFHRKLASFAISRSTDIDLFWYIISIYFNFSSVFIGCYNKHVWNFDDVRKMATPALLKRKAFWNKGYYIIYCVYDVTSQILLHDSNYIMDVGMWPKFSNSSICIRKVIITSIL